MSQPQVMKMVISGGRHAQPEGCPTNLYALLLLCWDAVPSVRPTFKDLIKMKEFHVPPPAAERPPATINTRTNKGNEFVSSGNEYSDTGFGNEDGLVTAPPAPSSNAFLEPPPPEGNQHFYPSAGTGGSIVVDF